MAQSLALAALQSLQAGEAQCVIAERGGGLAETPPSPVALVQENPFQCPECQKCFSRSSYLVKHRRIHGAGKPHQCPQCGKCFSQRSYLCKHRRIHAAAAGKPHECALCGKRFSLRSYLCKHRRIHTR
ncbi:zinc finger protein 2-like [Terrapene carolina triunguis]|uniref:zinc finger protein 2-like n=2 Tax=Emydidae TaxID=8476 RepID=UPI000CEF8E0A|nr:zinc finger protein 2-like [Terrapene carolina triunguis]